METESCKVQRSRNIKRRAAKVRNSIGVSCLSFLEAAVVRPTAYEQYLRMLERFAEYC